MQVHFSTHFKRQFKKLPYELKKQFSKRFELFLSDPNNPQINLHKLSGKYSGLWSINITGDIRAILDRNERDTILFVAIGSHSELYK